MDNEYLNRLPKNELLAANVICLDFLEEKLPDDAEDIAYALEVLLADKLPEGWDAELEADEPKKTTFFGTPVPSKLMEKKIALIHRHVKALSTKAIIQNPSLINTFLLEVSDTDKVEVDKLLAQARDAQNAAIEKLFLKAQGVLSEAQTKERNFHQKLVEILHVMGGEIAKKHSDFRTLLNCMVQATQVVDDAGPPARPAFNTTRKAFLILDKARQAQEALEVPPIRKALPPPRKWSGQGNN